MPKILHRRQWRTRSYQRDGRNVSAGRQVRTAADCLSRLASSREFFGPFSPARARGPPATYGISPTSHRRADQFAVVEALALDTHGRFFPRRDRDRSGIFGRRESQRRAGYGRRRTRRSVASRPGFCQENLGKVVSRTLCYQLNFLPTLFDRFVNFSSRSEPAKKFARLLN